jgi:hypothetical protein
LQEFFLQQPIISHTSVGYRVCFTKFFTSTQKYSDGYNGRQVTYTTQAEFAPHNAANIRQVMAAQEALADPGITYFASIAADGKTFAHTALFQTAEAQKVLFAQPAFQHFQSELKASRPEVPPQQELQTMIAGVGAVFEVETGLV